MVVCRLAAGLTCRTAFHFACLVLTYFACYGLVLPPQLAPQVWAAWRDPSGPTTRSTSRPAVAASDDTALQLRQAGVIFDLVEQVQKAVPRDRFDADAIIGEVGTDPDALVKWVRDHTAWVPYLGTLRGPRGVLMDRLGNGLDRSLLLADLLRLAGHQARIARAELAAARAVELLPALGLRRPDLDAETFELDSAALNLEQLVATAMQRLNVSEEEIREQGLSVRYQNQRRQEDAMLAVSQQVRALSDQMGWSPAAGDGGEPAPTADVVAAAQDLYWVQLKVEEKWRDLAIDLPPDAQVPAAKSTFAPDAIPRSLQHRVGVRVVLERWSQGNGIEEATAVAHQFAAGERGHEPLTVFFKPLDGPAADTASAAETDDLAGLAQATTQWLPTIQQGGTHITDSAFDLSGQLKVNTGDHAGARKMSRARDALGGLDALRSKTASHLTAMWLEYEIIAPGQPQRIIRRQIMDVLGPAARAAGVAAFELTDEIRASRALAFLGQSQILTLNCELSRSALLNQSLDLLLRYRSNLQRMVYARETEDAEQMAKVMEGFDPPPARLLEWALARHQWSARDHSMFYGQVNVVSEHTFLESDGDRTALLQAIDIVWNALTVRPDVKGDHRLLHLEQGVLDTVAESNLDRALTSSNTASLFAYSRLEGLPWLMMRGPPELKGVDLSPDVEQRISSALSSGLAVVAPARLAEGGASAAWWEIDPDSGRTLGIGEQGWGTELTARVILESMKTFVVGVVKRYGASLVCAFVSALVGLVVSTLVSRFTDDLMVSLFVGAVVNFLVDKLLCPPFAEAIESWSSRMVQNVKTVPPPPPPLQLPRGEETARELLDDILKDLAENYDKVPR